MSVTAPTSNPAAKADRRWSLNPLVTSGLIAALVLLLFVAFVAFQTISIFVETTLWVSETRNVLAELRQWDAQLEITDSDQWRYIAGRDTQFKGEVAMDMALTQKELADVIDAVQDNPVRLGAIKRIQELADAKAHFMAQRIYELEHDQDLPKDWIHKSNELLWQVRRAANDFIVRETDAVNLRSRDAERLGRRVMIIVPVTIGLSLCILGAMVFLLNREVGQRIRAEAEIWEANKQLDQRVQERTGALQLALAELEGFSYSVAHDLRAPIRAIVGYSGVLLETSGGALSDENRELLSSIGREAGRMGRLIDDLLRFSRLGRQSMAAAPVDMTRSARETFQELTAAEQGRSFDFRLSTLPEAIGDAAMLRQVWVNLLSNAIKFTASRQPAVIEVSSVPSDQELVYRVKDNGAGFDMKYAANIFKPFHRLHTDAEFPGTGIGLALVERIIRRHGGRVWAEGEPDRGAVFYFALPRKQRAWPVNFTFI